jgi:hypothetical protein
MKAHVLTEPEWNRIRDQIRQDFGQSMILLRGKMRNELGFTPRDHVTWPDGRYCHEVHIDFYTEEARTWFLLKYC